MFSWVVNDNAYYIGTTWKKATTKKKRARHNSGCWNEILLSAPKHSLFNSRIELRRRAYKMFQNETVISSKPFNVTQRDAMWWSRVNQFWRKSKTVQRKWSQTMSTDSCRQRICFPFAFLIKTVEDSIAFIHNSQKSPTIRIIHLCQKPNKK